VAKQNNVRLSSWNLRDETIGRSLRQAKEDLTRRPLTADCRLARRRSLPENYLPEGAYFLKSR
jgi:hypothetical protein